MELSLRKVIGSFSLFYSPLPSPYPCCASLYLLTLSHLVNFTLTWRSQGENQWLHLSLITDLKKSCLQVFPNVQYAYTTIPTYPSGQIGFMVCCKDKDRDLKTPLRSWSEQEEKQLCKYYNKAIHSASFVLPNFARKALR